MAFCPNCGTPNTDQAQKCVSCAFELQPKQKAKFKGTMLMTGVQAPQMPKAQAAPAPAPAVAPAAAPTPTPNAAAPASKSLGFEKTMMGAMVAPPQAQAAAPQPAPPQLAPTVPSNNQGFAPVASDLARAATIEQPGPPLVPRSSPPGSTPAFKTPSIPPAASSPRSVPPAGPRFGATMSEIPVPPKRGGGKLILMGAAVVGLLVVIAALVMMLLKK